MIARNLSDILETSRPKNRLRGRKRLGKRWSTAHDACSSCQTCDHPHLARGLCYRCYHDEVNRKRQAERTEKRALELFPKPIPRRDL